MAEHTNGNGARCSAKGDERAEAMRRLRVLLLLLLLLLL